MAQLSALARLKKGANFTPTKRTAKLSDGTVFEFYAAPMNMAERERAEAEPGGDGTRCGCKAGGETYPKTCAT